MAKHKYDVVATVGKYEKNGETKYISRKVGAVIQTDKGFRMKMDAFFNPAGCKVDEDGSIWLALFEPRDDQQQTQQQAPRQAQRSQQAAPPDFDDDLPFANPYRGARSLLI
jgi:single-strand DNA-binding protein